jgi:hypothetical protein
MLAEQRSPGDLDDLGAGVDGDLEASVQVVGRERRARRHREILVAAAGTGR